ncbi:MAG: hypothetical protein IJA83_07370 [Clostridia bacterium]|nr:hypothetical protein [Clostridia bacterium]
MECESIYPQRKRMICTKRIIRICFGDGTEWGMTGEGFWTGKRKNLQKGLYF